MFPVKSIASIVIYKFVFVSQKWSDEAYETFTPPSSSPLINQKLRTPTLISMGIPWYLATTRIKNILRDYGLKDQNISMYIRVCAPSTFLRPSFVCHQIKVAWGRQHSGCLATRGAADWESGWSVERARRHPGTIMWPLRSISSCTS